LEWPRDNAPNNLGRRHGHAFACEYFIQCVRQIPARGISTIRTVAKLVVDTTAVTHDSVTVEHKHFRIARGPEQIGDAATFVFKRRKCDFA
jgi:hypothetical protein